MKCNMLENVIAFLSIRDGGKSVLFHETVHGTRIFPCQTLSPLTLTGLLLLLLLALKVMYNCCFWYCSRVTRVKDEQILLSATSGFGSHKGISLHVWLKVMCLLLLFRKQTNNLSWSAATKHKSLQMERYITVERLNTPACWVISPKSDDEIRKTLTIKLVFSVRQRKFTSMHSWLFLLIKRALSLNFISGSRVALTIPAHNTTTTACTRNDDPIVVPVVCPLCRLYPR